MENNLAYLKQKLENFQNALNKLEKILLSKENIEYKIDATIKRFELTYELSWKLIKAFLEYKGIIAKTPRDSFKEAFFIGILEDSESWINMIEDRNITSHTYEEDSAKEICEKIRSIYFPNFTNLANYFQQELK